MTTTEPAPAPQRGADTDSERDPAEAPEAPTRRGLGEAIRDAAIRGVGLLGSPSTFIVLAVAALVVMKELDRMIGDVVTEGGIAHTLSSVIGPAGIFLWGAAWGDWATAVFTSVGDLIVWHTLLDLLFIVSYAVLLLQLFERCVVKTQPSASALRRGQIIIWALVITDVVEDVLLLALVWVPGAESTALVGAQSVVTVGKWIATAVVVVYVLFSKTVGDPTRRWLGRAAIGLYGQRLVAIAVGALALFSILGSGLVFEQLADLYRSWWERDRFGWTALLWTVVAFLGSGAVLFWLARARTRRYSESAHPDPRDPSPLAPWFVVAGCIAVLGTWIGLAHGQSTKDWAPFGIFIVVLVAIPAISLLIRRPWRKVDEASPSASPEAADPPSTIIRRDDQADAPAVRRTGDALVAAWYALLGLGPLRSLVAPIALAATGEYASSEYFDQILAPLLLAAVGCLLVAVLGVTIFRAVASAPAPTAESKAAERIGLLGVMRLLMSPAKADDREKVVLRHAGTIVLVLSSAVIVGYLVAPIAISMTVGPAATLVLLVGAWAGVLGWITVSLGSFRPLEVFARLRLRSAPIVVLLIVLPLAAASVQNAPAIHAVRFDADGSLHRDDLSDAYQGWYEDDQTCAVKVGADRLTVKPLVLVAAEGGGIRAATWTVEVLSRLPKTDEGDPDCAARSVFLSSGASGGSIGLATFHGLDSGTDPAEHDTDAIAGTDALGAALSGLLAGDLVGAVSGIRVPNGAAPREGGFAWRDRTGLQELTWEDQMPWLRKAFDASPATPTGYLVLTSADSTSLCKVLVSQLELREEVGVTPTPGCASPQAEFGRTIDLVDYLGERCAEQLSWASAATLSARFPFVSAGGRIAPETVPSGCDVPADLQLVDGGLVDNSAIGTLVDVAPQLTGLIRETNAAADGETLPYVMPIVMFVSNEPGVDVVSEVDPTRPEALVPIAAMLEAKGEFLSPSAWLTRASDAYSAACPTNDVGADAPADATCRSIQQAIAGTRPSEQEGPPATGAAAPRIPYGVVYVSPATVPAAAVPLGWSLSTLTRSQLVGQATRQQNCTALSGETGESCASSGSYAPLGRFISLFTGAEPLGVER